MPQATTLQITDTAGTSNYDPVSITGGVAEFAFGGDVPIGDKRITISAVRTQAGRRKITLKGVFPVVQTSTVDGIDQPVNTRTAYGEVSFSFDKTSTADEREDVIKGFISLFTDTDNAWLNPVLYNTASIY